MLETCSILIFMYHSDVPPSTGSSVSAHPNNKASAAQHFFSCPSYTFNDTEMSSTDPACPPAPYGILQDLCFANMTHISHFWTYNAWCCSGIYYRWASFCPSWSPFLTRPSSFICAPRPHEVRWLGANRPGCSQVGYLATPSGLHLGGRVPSTLAPPPAPVSSRTRSRSGASAAEHTTALSGMRWVVY